MTGADDVRETCSQCGREWAAPACGLGHAMKASELSVECRTFAEDELREALAEALGDAIDETGYRGIAIPHVIADALLASPVLDQVRAEARRQELREAADDLGPLMDEAEAKAGGKLAEWDGLCAAEDLLCERADRIDPTTEGDTDA